MCFVKSNSMIKETEFNIVMIEKGAESKRVRYIRESNGASIKFYQNIHRNR